MMLAENEERNPWQPLHVELGFPKEANVVTAVGAEGTRNLLGTGLSSKAYLKMVADHLIGLEQAPQVFGVIDHCSGHGGDLGPGRLDKGKDQGVHFSKRPHSFLQV